MGRLQGFSGKPWEISQSPLTPGSSSWAAHLGIIQRAQMEGREPLACPVPFIGSPHAEGAALQPNPEALSVHSKWGGWGTTWVLIPCP